MVNKPRLRRSFDIVNLGDEGLLLKSEHSSVKLEGKDIQEFLHVVIPLLDGTRTIHQIHLELSVYKKEDIDKGIELLLRSGLIEEGYDVEYDEKYPQFEFYRDMGYPKELIMKKFKNFKIAVFGLGAHGAHLVFSLANEGVGNIKCFDPSEINKEDLYLSTLYTNGDVGKRKEDVALRYLQKRFPDTFFEVSNVQVVDENSVEKWVEDCDFAICCMDKSFRSIYYWLNKASLKSGLVWSSASINGVEAVIGPTIVPHKTACYMCYRMRLIANEESYVEAISYERYLDEQKKDELFRRSNLAINGVLVGNILALEAIKHLIGYAASPLISKICVFSLLTLQTGFHTILKRPDCPHCVSKKKDSVKHPSDAGDSEPQKILDLESKLVSPRVGVIKGTYRMMKDEIEPDIPLIFGVALSNFNFQEDPDPSSLSCSGKGNTVVDAKISALGEAVERYCGGMVDEEELAVSSYSQLTDAVNPQDLVLFAPEQYLSDSFPYAKYSDDTTLRWVKGRSLIKNEERLVPAIATYLHYNLLSKMEYLFPQTSNGLAAGSSHTHAVLNALLEAVERDAFLITWLCSLPMPQINLESVKNKQTRHLLDMYLRRGVKVHVNALILDTGIPTFQATAVDTSGGGPYMTVGLSADLDPEVGVLGAVQEIGQIRPHITREMRKPDFNSTLNHLKDFNNVKTIQDHEYVYASPKMSSAFDFLLKNENYLDVSELPCGPKDSHKNKLRWCVNHLSKLDNDVISVDLTTQDMADLGLSVARVVITGFQPMHFGYNERRLGGKRLFELPMTLGYYDKKININNLNIYPHPLG